MSGIWSTVLGASSALALQGMEGYGEFIARASRPILPRAFCPIRTGLQMPAHAPLGRSMDAREVDALGERQRLGEERSAADHEISVTPRAFARSCAMASAASSEGAK